MSLQLGLAERSADGACFDVEAMVTFGIEWSFLNSLIHLPAHSVI